MANVRTNLLTRGSKTTPYWNTVYTCPGLTTTIVKHVSLTNSSGAAAGVVIYGAASGATAALLSITLGATSSSNSTQYWVLRPADRLILRCDVAITLDFWISGAQLEGVAPSTPQGPVTVELLPA